MAVYLHDEVYKMGLSRFIDQDFVCRVTLRNPEGATIAEMMYAKLCAPININTTNYTIVFIGGMKGASIAFPQQFVSVLRAVPKNTTLYVAFTQNAKVVAYASIVTKVLLPSGSTALMPEVVIFLGLSL
ncbi:MAG: hypothetical protein D4R63_11340 [Methylococcaceae bacterium]|nr:MAG: hypothetical protein D4R63_11340 [Methylococcaceae bacterium]